MENEKTQEILYFIGVIIKLTGNINNEEFNETTTDKKNLNESLKLIKGKFNVKCRCKNQRKKKISKIDSPSIIYDNDGNVYLLANSNHEQVLIQRFGNHPPELWTLAEFNQIWSGKWLQIK